MKVSIIIPNYNGKDELVENLPSVMASAKDSEIIVVDDASNDGSIDMLEKKFPTISLIRKKENKGFASSVNEGVKFAKGDLILLLNHDVCPSEDLLSFLIPHFDDRNVFAVGCLEKSKEEGKMELRGRGIGCFEKGLLIHERGEVNMIDTLWVSGGASMFRKQYWQKLGGMDEIYNPFYWEDIDLSYRAQKAGYRIIFEPRSIVLHRHEKGAIKRLYSRCYINTIAHRNQILFVWLNITDVIYLIEHLLYLPYHAVRSIVSGDFAFIHAFLQAVLIFPKVMMKRIRNLRLSKKSDREILKRHVL